MNHLVALVPSLYAAPHYLILMQLAEKKNIPIFGIVDGYFIVGLTSF